jgi:hypothetical protein
MQAGLVDLLKFREEQAIHNRDEFLNAAQKAGKFARQRAHYEGPGRGRRRQTRSIVDALATNTVPSMGSGIAVAKTSSSQETKADG